MFWNQSISSSGQFNSSKQWTNKYQIYFYHKYYNLKNMWTQPQILFLGYMKKTNEAYHVSNS